MSQHIRTTNHSDDCAAFYADGEGVGPDEYECWGKWWPLVVDGKTVAHIMTTFGDGWEFHIRATEDHDIEVEFPKRPEHEYDCRCCLCEDECDEDCQHY